MIKPLLVSFLFLGFSVWSQTTVSKQLSYEEFLGYVKKYHPLVKSANLQISAAQANLMMARGALDPKIAVDFEQKKFKDKEYYSILNSSFKIPVWYGIEVKAGFDNNDGVYLNPENTVPKQGLASLGITVPLGQGLLINQRMADIGKAKIQMKLSAAERNLEVVSVLYDASISYITWLKNYKEVQLYQKYLSNAELRYKGVSTLIEQGDKPAIDSIEAGILVRNRMLSLEESRLKLMKAQLDLSNFLWLEDNVPLELQDDIVPEENLVKNIREILGTTDFIAPKQILDNHPKINALEGKIGLVDIERKLKANALLPKIDLGYSYLSEPGYFENDAFRNYKVGVSFSFPVFLRKERGSLQLAKYKLQDLRFALDVERLQLQNKIKAQQSEIQSLDKQQKIIENLVKDNDIMLRSEDRLFSYGESSIFLINARENNLIAAQLSKITIENRFLESNISLFRVIGNPF